MRNPKTTWLALVLAMLLTGPAMAEVKAVIDGPTAAAAGDLVVLSAGQAKGDGFRWISPEGLQTLQCGGQARELAFASGKAGQYTFVLVVADTEANIDYATHTVVIGGSVDPGPGEPEPEPEPTPGQFGELVKISQARARVLNDPPTAAAIAAAIRQTDADLGQLCEQGACPGLGVAKNTMVAAIEAALATRRGASLQVDWAGGWRTPVNDYLQRSNPADVPTYRAAMRAAAMGLVAE